MTEESAVRRAGIGLRSERGPVLGAVMMCTALIAVDGTVLAAAVPSIVTQLGGFSQFPWLFSIYLLTQAVTTPIYGRLADIFGRRPVLLLGIGLFLAGSVLCGAAWSMPVLIVARALQGLGAGAIQPTSITILGDIYSVAERARVQGYIAAVWGISGVAGPAIGGVFSEYLSWRWIFFINLPFGALAIVMLLRHLSENVERRRHTIDYPGALLLTLSFGLLILGLLEGGVAWAWGSAPSVAVLGGGAVLLAAFLWVESRAPEPVLPLWVLRRRVLVGANLSQLGVGVLLMGVTSYVPTFAQGVLGYGPVLAGSALAGMLVGWPISASQAGRVYLRIGFRDTSLVGAVLVAVSVAACSLWNVHSGLWLIVLVSFGIGVGMGFASAPTMVAIQSVVGWERRGVVTSTTMFARSIGSAVGVAVFGALVNSTLAARLTDPPAALRGQVPDSLDATTLALQSGTSGPAVDFVRSALEAALHNVFVAFLPAGLLIVLGVALMPRRAHHLETGEPVLAAGRE